MKSTPVSKKKKPTVEELERRVVVLEHIVLADIPTLFPDYGIRQYQQDDVFLCPLYRRVKDLYHHCNTNNTYE